MLGVLLGYKWIKSIHLSNTIDKSNTSILSNTYMQVFTTVTQKGQVTLPKVMRDLLRIQPYDMVSVEQHNQSIIIRPKNDILDLAGTLKPRKNADKSPLQARDAMEQAYTRK